MPGGGPGSGAFAAGAAGAVSGAPHAWQYRFPSGFWTPHRAQVKAI